MTVCPFCKKPVSSAKQYGPCPSCGRRASDHPGLQQGTQGGGGPTLGDGWGDDDVPDQEGLDLAKGSGVAGAAPMGGGGGGAGASAYGGGGLSFGDDDDPFAEDVPDGALELDVPSHHAANTPRAVPTPPTSSPKLPASGPHLPVAGRGSDPRIAAAQEQHPPPPSSRSGSNPSLGQAAPSDPSMQAAHDGSDGAIPAAGESHPSEPQIPVRPPPPPPKPVDPAAMMIARFPSPPAKIWEAPIYAMKVLWRQLELRQDLASLRKKRSPDVALYERALKTHDSKTFMLGLAITCATLAIFSFIFFLPVILRFMRDPD